MSPKINRNELQERIARSKIEFDLIRNGPSRFNAIQKRTGLSTYTLAKHFKDNETFEHRGNFYTLKDKSTRAAEKVFENAAKFTATNLVEWQKQMDRVSPRLAIKASLQFILENAINDTYLSLRDKRLMPFLIESDAQFVRIVLSDLILKLGDSPQGFEAARRLFVANLKGSRERTDAIVRELPPELLRQALAKVKAHYKDMPTLLKSPVQ